MKRSLPHLVLLAVIVAELVVAAALHRSEDRLDAAWRDGREPGALHVLLSRGEPVDGCDASCVADLLAAPDPRTRALAFTNEVCRLTGPDAQNRYFVPYDAAVVAREWIPYVVHRRKVGTGATVGAAGKLRRQEVGWWLDRLRGEEIDAEALTRFLRERAHEAIEARR